MRRTSNTIVGRPGFESVDETAAVSSDDGGAATHPVAMYVYDGRAEPGISYIINDAVGQELAKGQWPPSGRVLNCSNCGDPISSDVTTPFPLPYARTIERVTQDDGSVVRCSVYSVGSRLFHGLPCYLRFLLDRHASRSALNEELGREMARELFGMSPEDARCCVAAPDTSDHERYLGKLSAEKYLAAGPMGVETREIAHRLCGGVSIREAQCRDTTAWTPAMPHRSWNPRDLSRDDAQPFQNLPLPNEGSSAYQQYLRDLDTGGRNGDVGL